MLGLLKLLLFGVAIATSADLERSVVLKLSELRKVGTVDEKYLSFAIDSHVIAERWKNLDFDSARVKEMARALSPAYIR